MGHARKTGLIAVVVVVMSAVAGRSIAVADPVIMAAGDIACASTGPSSPGTCSQAYTSDLLLAQKSSAEGLAAVLTLGDNQYEYGALADFRSYFGPTWGRLGSLLRPALGNHEYWTTGATGYFDYFTGLGIPTGNRGEGWYSYDIGSWHLIALNSSDGCSPVSCAKGSAQEAWLQNDLAGTSQPCLLAYWHHPLYELAPEKAIWQDLYDAGTDLVMVGHDHTYRKPIAHDASGNPDASGPREVIVGTGGYGYSGGIYGVLKLTLHAGSFDWSFVGTGATDSGSAACHSTRLPPPTPPTASFTTSASGLAVSFKDTSTGSPTSWSWNFGDGTTSSAQSPSHTYAQAATYTVTLTATNTGGSTSATKQVTVTAPPPGTLTVNAHDDAQVKSTTPGKKYGSLATLSVREASDVTYRTYLKFQVSGLTGTVSDVRLRLKVDGSSGSDGPDSGDAYLVSGTTWTESTLSWSSAPAITTLPVGTAVAAPLAGTIQIDLHTAITTNGTYTVALKSHSTDTVVYTSKEGGSPPQLLFTTG